MNDITRDRTAQEEPPSPPSAPVSREEFDALREKVAAQAHALWWIRTVFMWIVVWKVALVIFSAIGDSASR